jgi:hypothetical protein
MVLPHRCTLRLCTRRPVCATFPADLIAIAIAAQQAQSARNWNYTCREDHEQQQLDKR